MADGRDHASGPGAVHARAWDRRRARRVVRARGFVPVEANLQRPRLRDGLVVRGELVDTLREHADVPVVVLTGPPGYGKTTLLAQWDDEDERPFAFLSLDRSSNDPAVLVTYLILALQRLGDVDIGVVGALADRSPVTSVLLPRLGRMLAQRQKPFVLVVDDAEAVTSPASLDVLLTVIRHLPAGSQLAVAARSAPELPLSQLRAEGRLLLLDANDLRLTPTEARAVLAAEGVELPPADLAALLDRTEGWPAGVYLAALGLRETAQRRDPVTTYGGTGSVVADYLRDELLASMPAERRLFLVRTSVLARMCGPLCDAVLGSTGSWRMLRELERSNLFVVPLDGHEHWYRYHRLFADVLHDELSREDPSVVVRLHARASRWLETAGDVDEAVNHALAAHEVERAAHLVWSHCGSYLASGRVATLRRWLDGFDAEQLTTHAKLALTRAWYALETGRPVDHWVAAAERGLFDANRPGGSRSVESNLALLHAARAADGVRRMAEDAERAVRLQAPEDPWRAFASYLQAVAALLSGAVDEARRDLETAERLAEALAMPAHQALCLGQLAVLAAEAGCWDEAGRLSDHAAGLLADHGTADAPMQTVVPCVTALVLARQGRADEARQTARRTMRAIAATGQVPPWLAVQTRYLLARAHLMNSDPTAARVLLSEAQNQLRATPDADWLRTRLDEAWAHVEMHPLTTGVGPSALTTAELRVLQLLPTHLSFEQIGKRLYVSRNTVKTEAIAAYRKLGVSSRAEAVERAVSLGMIQL